MRPRLGVVADDITGSGDIGGMFAERGYAVRIFSAGTDLQTLPERLKGRRTDVVIVDTDSRFDAPREAARKVREATRALGRWGAECFWKKTCSAFRGNVGPEMDAMLDALGVPFGVAVAAFPRNGRVTRGGIHYVHGVPLAESEFARDPVHPRTDSNLVRDLAGQTPEMVDLLMLETVRGGAQAVEAAMQTARARGVRYLLSDVETQDDLAVLARALAGTPVLLGSSALADEMAKVWPLPAPFDPLAEFVLPPGGPVLVVAGSTMPQTRAQVDHARAGGMPLFTLPTEAALDDPEAAGRALADQVVDALLGGQAQAIVRSENWPEAVDAARRRGAVVGLSEVETSRRISEVLARAARLVREQVPLYGLVVLGGDTSGAVCRALGVDETVVVREIEAGLPSTVAASRQAPCGGEGVRGDGLLLVLKSGSFGKSAFVSHAIEHLRALGRGASGNLR